MFQTIIYRGHYIHIKQFTGEAVIQVNLVKDNLTQTVIECNTLLGAKRLITNSLNKLNQSSY